MDDEETYPMWGYWRDKKGILSAITEQYPELMKTNPELTALVACYRSYERAIDHLMTELEV